MVPDWKSEDETLSLFAGDCRLLLPQFPENLFTACVTDPPYELGFMGKDWDKSGAAFSQETWAAVLRTLKPGAHLLAFGGTRTYHRICCAIEDAGFEIRDCIMWIYGSGFPKSLDVSKAIDKAAGAEREAVGVKVIGGNSPDRETFGANDRSGGKGMGFRPGEIPVTAPHTSAAKLWSGYGTALKPAYEPIIVARKPLNGTVAANCLEHGCGAINIDGCRVDLAGDYKCGANGRPSQTGLGDNYDPSAANQHSPVGRWPANVIHDGSEEVLAGFPQTTSGAMKRDVPGYGDGSMFLNGRSGPSNQHGDFGSAARFFYCAKAGKAERGSGNNHPTVKPLALMEYLVKLVAMPSGNKILDPFAGSGTTLLACYNQFIEATGIDLEAKHVDIAGGRAAVEEEKTPLLKSQRDTQRTLL